MNSKTTSIAERFEEAFMAHKDNMYDFAIKLMNDQAETEDIVHEAFIRLYDQFHKRAEIHDIKNWLFIVTRNLCYTRLKRIRKQADYSEQIIENRYEENPSAELTYFVERALGQLDDKYREVLILRTYFGYSYEEIARILHKSIPAVKSLLFKARKKLQKQAKKSERSEKMR
ncbi:MAG: RNA polymerase sigma factor [candidate division Zixibacteria bacterium]